MEDIVFIAVPCLLLLFGTFCCFFWGFTYSKKDPISDAIILAIVVFIIGIFTIPPPIIGGGIAALILGAIFYALYDFVSPIILAVIGAYFIALGYSALIENPAGGIVDVAWYLVSPATENLLLFIILASVGTAANFIEVQWKKAKLRSK